MYPVSILKPLKGVEEGLRENLQSFFDLDYPCYEIIFSIQHWTDPARALIEEMIQQNPQTAARLLICEIDLGPNPKVNNLILSYKKAKYDLLLISDSNVRVNRDYLKRQVAHLDTSVGMVTSVVAGQNAAGIGGNLEGVYLNTFYARWMELTATFGHACVVGKSMLFRRSTSERFGGIRILARYLAEDYMAGEAVRRLGLRIIIATDPIRQYIGDYAFSTFWSRHLRWGRIRKSQAPLIFFAEPFFGAVLSGMLGCFGFAYYFGVSPFYAFALHMSVWFLCDTLVAMELEPNPSSLFPLIWVVREFLALPLWFHTAIGKTVQWRGRSLTLKPGGLLEDS